MVTADAFCEVAMLSNFEPPAVGEILARLHSLPATALFTSAEAGLYLNARTDLLRAWRFQGRGPDFVGRGHFVRYPKGSLDAFLGDQTCKSQQPLLAPSAVRQRRC